MLPSAKFSAITVRNGSHIRESITLQHRNLRVIDRPGSKEVRFAVNKTKGSAICNRSPGVRKIIPANPLNGIAWLQTILADSLPD
ncbi:hypothetical protein CDAR_212141 [Caerostris darwini]|uniref:Uncharacterized protein n=1 Tax=Caerostris darwini TaxID=1538125 RepID=A0AAV4NVD3_9ARAC|nr:hypothetical protein CDAR_212141 [Caerostris darwini]